MSTRAVSVTALVCILLGVWLPSLWLPAPPAASPRVLLPPAPPVSSAVLAPESLRSAVRRQRSPMAMLQAVVAGISERGFGVSGPLRDLSDFGFNEAEELALFLAGESAGRNVKDGAAFLQGLAKQQSDPFQEAALQSWAESNPDAALAGLMKLSGHNLWSRHEVIRALAARNPDKVLAAVRASPPAKDRKYLWDAVLRGCADSGTDVALKAMPSAPANARRAAMEILLKKLAADDPRAALAWRESLPPELRELAKLETVFEAWAKQDPAAALKEWKQRDEKNPPPWQVMNAWAVKDPEAFYQWINQEGNDGAGYLSTAIENMADKDSARAMQMLATAPAELRAELLPRLGEKRALRDPRAALEWVRSLPAEEKAAVLVAMIPHLSSLPAEERRVVAMEAGTGTPDGFRLLYDVDHSAAEKTLTELPPVKALAICKNMSSRLTESSPAAAAPFVTALVQALSDPASAKELAAAPSAPPAVVSGNTNRSSSFSGGRLSLDENDAAAAPNAATIDVVNIIASLTTTWSAIDPVPASAWIATLPAGEPQSAAAANLALTWGRYDLPAARAWVEQLPAGGAHDQAAEQITRLTKSAAPEQREP